MCLFRCSSRHSGPILPADGLKRTAQVRLNTDTQHTTQSTRICTLSSVQVGESENKERGYGRAGQEVSTGRRAPGACCVTGRALSQ